MSTTGIIFMEALTIGVFVYLAYIFVDDWRENRKFWKEQTARQKRME